MRKIKFKAWDKKRQVGMVKNPRLDVVFGDKRYIILQFTGLKDKNKKEIYDGDILEFWIGGEEIFKELYELSYSEERACWQINIIKKCNHVNSPQFYSEHLTQTYASCMKVIGNIYENKELLKGKN